MTKNILGESPIPTQSFISGKDMDGDGIIVSINKKYEAVDQKEDTPDMYKTKDSNPLVKSDIIKENQTLRYYFVDTDGVEVAFDNTSWGFLKELHRFNPEAGQKFRIQRKGSGTDTKYVMTEVDQNEADSEMDF